MSTNPRIVCPVCGYLHRFSVPVPLGKKAICKNCQSYFIVTESVDAIIGSKFQTIDVGGNGGSITHCVGEHHRIDTLREFLHSLSHERDSPLGLLTRTCVLIPETNNPHDANAVRVEIDGFHLCYLSRKDAALHRDAIKNMEKPLFRTRVQGCITVEWDQDNEEQPESFHVVLDISWQDTESDEHANQILCNALDAWREEDADRLSQRMPPIFAIHICPDILLDYTVRELKKNPTPIFDASLPRTEQTKRVKQYFSATVNLVLCDRPQRPTSLQQIRQQQIGLKKEEFVYDLKEFQDGDWLVMNVTDL